MKMFLVELFMIKSKYLFLYLVSISFKPVWTLGNICKQGERSWTLVGVMDNSPVLLLQGKPVTPMISPLLKRPLASSKLYSVSVYKLLLAKT